MAEDLTIAPIRRMLKKAGDLRISEEASEELRRIIGEFGTVVAEEAVRIAKSENRKTVLERDIKRAVGKVLVSGEIKAGE
jgi:histone H3/H4